MLQYALSPFPTVLCTSLCAGPMRYCYSKSLSCLLAGECFFLCLHIIIYCVSISKCLAVGCLTSIVLLLRLQIYCVSVAVCLTAVCLSSSASLTYSNLLCLYRRMLCRNVSLIQCFSMSSNLLCLCRSMLYCSMSLI